MGKTFKRLDGETMPQFQARIASIQAASRPAPPPRKWRRTTKPSNSRVADHIDGFDRDDIGASED